MEGRHRESPAGAQRRRRQAETPFERLLGAITAIAVLLAMAGVPALVIGGGSWLGAYDSLHMTTVECSTTTADTRHGKYGGFSIRVRTKDCGDVSLRRVGRDDADRIIADIEHQRVRFTIGEGTFNLMPVFRAVHLWPSVYEYTKLR